MNISLEHILGFKVKVTNVLDNVVQGRVYSFNSSNNVLTLVIHKKGKPPTFKIIRTSFIKSLEVVSEKPHTNSFRRDPFKPSFVDIQRIKQQLNARMHAVENEYFIRQKESVSSR